jgi:hypothetical protein
MKKEFTFTIPDNPYTTDVNEEKTINAVYDGPRYVVARWEPATGIVHNVVYGADNESALELDKWVEDGHEFFVIDASEHPFEVAYLTHNYTHENIENPTYTHGECPTTGIERGEWTYTYADTTGGLSQIHYAQDLRYDSATRTFTPPRFREHAIDETEFYEGVKKQSALIKASIAVPGNYTTADAAILAEHADWLLKLEDAYKNHGIPHWQIPFPKSLPAIV